MHIFPQFVKVFAFLVLSVCGIVARAQDVMKCNNIQIRSKSHPGTSLEQRKNLRKEVVYSVPVALGATSFRIRNTCLLVEASFVSDYFDGLKRRWIGEQTSFTKDEKAVNDYPSDTEIEVDVVPSSCGDSLLVSPEIGLAEELRFSIVQLAGSKENDIMAKPIEAQKSAWSELPPIAKSYLYELDSHSLSLLDTIQLRIYHENVFLGCISGKL